VDEYYHPYEILFDYVPTLFVEVESEAIWSWGFVFIELV